MQQPRVAYLRTEHGHLGWRRWTTPDAADGPVILNVGEGFMASIEDVPDEPRLERWYAGLAAIGPVISYDPPGIGISDGADATHSFAAWSDTSVRVLDAAGVEAAHVLAGGASSFTALQLVARHPERVASLTLINGAARVAWGEDYPEGLDPAAAEQMSRAASDPSAAPDEGPSDAPDMDLMIQAPSMVGDAAFTSWWGRVARRNARPRVAGPMNEEVFSTDLRPVLPGIEVPTLVIARRDMAIGTGMTRVIADLVPGARYVEVPGADMLPFLGDSALLLDEIREHLTGERHPTQVDRVFAAVLFTDLVGSTDEVVRRGDGPWRALLLDHGAMVRTEVARHGGRLVQDLGDGTLCTFPAPGAAIRCALSLVRRSATHLGVAMRAGIHAGEVEMRGEDLAGINVHTAARVSGLAEGGEVLVSSTVVDLVAGASFGFTDRGVHDLKGVPGQRQLWAVAAT